MGIGYILLAFIRYRLRPSNKPLLDLVACAVERSLTLYLEASAPRSALPSPTEAWIPLREAVQGTPYSQEYLSLLARKGRLEAIKRGRIWFATGQAVEAYRRSVAPKKQDTS